MTKRESELITLLHKEVKPALGCTEPIAVALAAAKAAESFSLQDRKCKPVETNVEVSGNILKNGMGVGIPGTGMIGLHIAAALGSVCGKSEYGLEVLKDLDDEDVAAARLAVKEKRVRIELADTAKLLYVKVTVKCGDDYSWAVIEDDHDRIVETGFNGKVCKLGGKTADNEPELKGILDYNLSVKEILSFARAAAYEDIKFILKDRDLNLALALDGLEGDYGLNVGKAIRENQNEILGDDFMSFDMGMTAAA